MDVDAIFDGFARFSAAVHLHDEIRKLQRRIRNSERRECGNCNHWMKSSCKPEKEGGNFKSMSSYACKDFVPTAWDIKFTGELKAELDQLTKTSTEETQ